MSQGATKNVLFLSVDDLNDWTNFTRGYSGTVHTPNLDALMASGTTFTNAFAQVAICNPSRTSVLTGQEPLKTGVLQNLKDWEEEVDPRDTLFGVMKAAGYESIGVGKLFHTGASEAATQAMFDRYQYLGKDATGVTTEGLPAGPYEGTALLTDEIRANYIADFLGNYVPDPDKPLFLSAGLLSPHVDWVVPQQYFDLYPLDEIRIDAVPGDARDIPAFPRMLAGQTVPWSHADVSDPTLWKQLIQAYLATISYMDAQIGKILDALDSSAIADTTVTVLWSDHGYHLGDKDFWHKFTLWDNAAKAPLVIRDAGGATSPRVVTDVVELLDIFPTILDLTGVDGSGLALDGKSLVPYMNGDDPAAPGVAYTWMYGSVSVRTADFRFTLYEDGSEELYDIRNDPELVTNLAASPQFATIKTDLENGLRSNFNMVGYGEDRQIHQGSDSDDVFGVAVSGRSAAGGAGDDIYFVAPGTIVLEQVSGGRDAVVTRATNYTLPDNVEDLEMTGISALVQGNALANMITANAAEIRSYAGDDIIYSGDISGRLFLGAGADKGWGNQGADLLLGEAGSDSLFGGAGRDTLFGGDMEDVLQGGADNDRLVGDAGFDTLHGGDGADLLDGGDQADVLRGGNGQDVLVAGQGLDQLFGEAGFDWLQGGTGHDRLDGGNQADNLLGESDNDILLGGRGLDRLFGGSGNDTGYGGDDADALFGEAGDDLLFGQNGDDRVFGSTGNDRADGGAGHDWLFGGAGVDILVGGDGNDTVSGGFNADIFVFSNGFGHDVITDFYVANRFERIDLAQVTTILDATDLFANHIAQHGADVVIDALGGNTITLRQVDLGDLRGTSFIFV